VFICEEVMIANEIPERGRTAVYEFRPQLNHGRREWVMNRQDAATDAIARFEAEHGFPGARQNAGSSESGDAGSDDNDITAHA